jgi:hypothetical protein
LATCWCGGPPDWDFTAIGAAADEIRVVDDQTRWIRSSRRSGRTGESYSISGFIGDAVWTGVPLEIWGLLQAGAVLGVGKGCAFGNGQYELLPVSDLS